MLKKKLIRISSSIIKILLPLIFKILMKLKVNRRVINYLHDRSYFGNQKYDFSIIIRKLDIGFVKYNVVKLLLISIF